MRGDFFVVSVERSDHIEAILALTPGQGINCQFPWISGALGAVHVAVRGADPAGVTQRASSSYEVR